jgi:recombination protein RecA
MSTAVQNKALQEAARLQKKFGHKTGAVGSEDFKLNVVPTGSLALDYALGTGGWPLGHPVEVFGAPDIGKSSIIGFNAIKSAQQLGMLCGIVALEPGFDKDWAVKNGVDPEMLVVARPDDGESAFEILHDWMQDDIVDFTVFDSIGAIVAAGERKDEKNGMKAKVGGASALVTAGVKRILTPVWKHNKGLIFLNQQRDDMNSKFPGAKESPGGNALHHSAAIRIQLKPASGSPPFKAKVDGEDIYVGRTLVAVIKRNKLSEGTNRRAEFDYYNADSDESEVGIDTAKDVVATAIRTRVIEKAGGYYRHPSFPTDKHQIQGKDAVYDYILEHEESVQQIRQEVIEQMFLKVGGTKNQAPKE